MGHAVMMFVAGLCLAVTGSARVVQTKAQIKQNDKGNSMIAKVIEMLGEEKDKIKVDLAAEETTMAEYMQWCDDTQTELFYGIKSAKAKIEELTAVITDSTAQLAALDEDIAELGNEIAERNTEIEESEAIRAKDHAEFLKVEEEQVAMVEELEEMGVALKKQIAAFTQTPPPVTEAPEEEGAFLQKKSPAAEFDAFLQTKSNTNQKSNTTEKSAAEVKQEHFERLQKALQEMVLATWVDPETKKRLQNFQKSGAFLQAGEEPNIDAHDGLPPGESAGGAMNAMVADNEKNLEMFEGLKGKAEESLQKLRDEETKRQGEHDIQMMTLKQAIALAENDLDDAKKEHGRISQEKAEAEEEKVDVEASMAADEKSLEETKQECDATSAAWAKRQEEAKAEMAAIEKAKEILASRVTVFIQVKLNELNKGDDIQQTVKQQKTRQVLITHFRNLGNKLHSLAMLNLVTVAAQDPMANVKNLLTDLIAKLEKEAKEAADLHAFCQAEKKKTTAALEKKNMEIDKISTRIEMATSKKKELEELVASSSKEIAETEKVNAEATKLRTEQNANFVKVDADFSGAASAVDDAIDALQEYYGKSFIQMKSKTGTLSTQPTFGGAKSDSAGGIIGILETMGEEFRKTVKENAATEREAVKAYETLMQENKVIISTKEAEIKGAESQIKSLDVSIKDNGADLKMVNKEKGAVEDYVEKLKPQCEGRVVPYEERKAKMEAEISGLKEGLAILESESPSGAFASLLQVKQHAY
eukprot:gnl/MRDRNA2_/MRDRNA2_87729_c0_seq1.p1 gnl/MRDRNA2_/MRDRNA2_87729_c0~~gnl/MRDRNA2_/MRDRNA2_87729_c0_seq1.p1  ORF type:complete len:758 (+),score=258.32 gnl/MRDRNA2_/MRDRNA2_87729_c0_seq1:124-2397(+)